MTKFRFILLFICLVAITARVIGESDIDPLPEPLLNTTVNRTPMIISDITAAEQEVIKLTNQLRCDLGLTPVIYNESLALAARRHSQDMGNRNYFSHQAPAPAPYGTHFWQRADAAGYEGFAMGENIAAGYSSALSVFNAWKNSPGHYANMTNSNANEIGVGLAQVSGSQYFYYWTMGTGYTDGSGSCPKNHPATNLNVTGNVDTHPARPTFTWTHNTDDSDPDIIVPTQYRVVVYKNPTTYMSVLVNVGDVCNGTSCSYTPTEVELPNGLSQRHYDLWIGSLSPNLSAVWAGPFSFDITSGPGDVSMIAPANAGTVTEPIVDLEWSNDPDATWYQVYVTGPNGYVYDQWVPAEVCTTTCVHSIAPLTNSATYSWWMQAWGPGGYSLEWTSRNFTLNVTSAPAAVSGLNYSEQNKPNQVITWDDGEDASWYELIVTNQASNAQVHKKWYSALDICGGICVVDAVDLVNGSYTLEVRGWAPGHMGVYANTDANVSFDVPSPIAYNTRTPADNATGVNTTLILQWPKEDYTTWYYISLVGGGNTVLQGWFPAREICDSVCISEELNLTPNQTYSWEIKSWGPGASSVVSLPQPSTFTTGN